MISWVNSFKYGFLAPIRAAKLILKNPKILTMAAIPTAINLVLYVLFFVYGSKFVNNYLEQALGYVQHTLPHWAQFLYVVVQVLLFLLKWLVLGLFAMLSFTIVSGIVAAPFNDALSKAAAKAILTETQFKGFLELKVSQTVVLEIRRTMILIGGSLLALVLALIPFFQVLSFFAGAVLVSFEYFGYPLSQHSTRLRAVWTFTLQNIFISFGFGSFLLLVMALPFTSVLYLPLAVVGATIIYYERAGFISLPNQ